MRTENEQRNERGYRAVLAYSQFHETEEFETNASDLIADILHTAVESYGEEAEEVLARALHTYQGDAEDEA